MVGMTSSRDLALQSATQHQYGGGELDGFILGLNADDGRAIFTTYFGGEDRDLLEGITLRPQRQPVGVRRNLVEADFRGSEWHNRWHRSAISWTLVHTVALVPNVPNFGVIPGYMVTCEGTEAQRIGRVTLIHEGWEFKQRSDLFV